MHTRQAERNELARTPLLPQTRALVSQGEFSEAEELIARSQHSDPQELTRAKLLMHAASGSWEAAAEAGRELLGLLYGDPVSRFEYEFLNRIALCSRNSDLRRRLDGVTIEE